MRIPGIHHVTALASDPQRNLDFYTQILGLRLVKKTVNFDDPGTYHLYFGDYHGRPGSILTFFPYPGLSAGRSGNDQATAITFAVPSLDGWDRRLGESRREQRFGRDVLLFTDPDGLALELVATGGQDNGISGFHSVTLSHRDSEPTGRLLMEIFGYQREQQDGNRERFISSAGNAVELLSDSQGRRGRMGAGTIHHVAFRAETEPIQLAWASRLSSAKVEVTPVLDREYFRSIYFREPGGVLFEIATDPPGFVVDEPLENLGSALKLPSWLESSRARIESGVPALSVPEYVV